jgi:hypothetical protein
MASNTPSDDADAVVAPEPTWLPAGALDATREPLRRLVSHDGDTAHSGDTAHGGHMAPATGHGAIAPVLRRSSQSGIAATPSSQAATTAGQAGAGRQVLRRRISSLTKTSADISAVNGSAATKKGLLSKVVKGSKDSLYKIGVLLDRQATLNDPDAETVNLAALVTMCQHWLKRHQGDGDRAVAGLVEDILAEARRDHSKALAQQRYLADMKLGETPAAVGSKKKSKGKPASTPLTQQMGIDISGKGQNVMNLAREGDGPNARPRQKELAELMRSTGLTQAEVTAIIAYTASDYLYINPATANDANWLDVQQGAIAEAHTLKGRTTDHMDQRKMREDGVTQAGMLMQGLAKLPVMQGTVYRGARMSKKEFDEAYGRRTQIVYPAFTSSTTERSVCDMYAKGGGERAPKPEQTISVK